ncbi:MAG: hypothetical protein Hals2KO_32330 [Halioglobus sp.]
MNILSFLRKIFATFFVSLVLIVPAADASLIGDEINAIWSFLPFFTDDNTFVAADGVDLVGAWGGEPGRANDLDVKSLSIEVLFDFNGGLGAGVNWLFQDLDIDIVDAYVTTNYGGWDDSFFTFGEGFAQVNFSDEVNFQFDTNYFEIFFEVKDVTLPLPGSLFLMLMGLCAFFFHRPASSTVVRAR